MTLHPSNLGSTTRTGSAGRSTPIPTSTPPWTTSTSTTARSVEAQIQALAGGTQGAGNVACVPVRRGQRGDRDRLVGQRAQRDHHRLRLGGTNSCPGKVFLQRDSADEQPGLLEGPAELRAVHRRHPAEHGQLQAGPALLRGPRAVPDHAVLHGEPGRQGRRGRVRRRGQQQLLEHQRDAAGPALLRALRDYPTQYITRTRTASSSNGCPGTSTSTATTVTPTTTSSSSTGTRPTRPSAVRASTTTYSARTTGCSSRTWPASRPRLDNILEL